MLFQSRDYRGREHMDSFEDFVWDTASSSSTVFAVTEIQLKKSHDEEKKTKYWELELASPKTTPVSHLFDFSVENSPMRILSRSTSGMILVCASEEKMYVFSMALDIKWSPMMELPIPPSQVQKMVITDDKESQAMSVVAIGDPQMDDIYLDGPPEMNFDVEIPQKAILIHNTRGDIMLFDLLKEGSCSSIQSSDLKAQALVHYMKLYLDQKRNEIALAFEKHAVQMDPEDFILGFQGNASLYPSVMQTVKTHGRPTFSSDKGPRNNRCASLTNEGENQVCDTSPGGYICPDPPVMQGIFTFIAILKTIHAQLPVDQWTVSTHVQVVFSHTKIYKDILDLRTEQVL